MATINGKAVEAAVEIQTGPYGHVTCVTAAGMKTSVGDVRAWRTGSVDYTAAPLL